MLNSGTLLGDTAVYQRLLRALRRVAYVGLKDTYLDISAQ